VEGEGARSLGSRPWRGGGRQPGAHGGLWRAAMALGQCEEGEKGEREGAQACWAGSGDWAT
jgi:hypothetical protein